VSRISLFGQCSAVALLSLTVLACGSARVSAETLQDALAAAYLNNPVLSASRAQLRSVDENVPQALSGWRPVVTVTGSVGKGEFDTSIVTEQNLTPKVATLDLNQPLYRGGRTVAATRQAEAQVQAGREQLRGSERDVLLAAVTAYLDVVRDGVRVGLTRNNEQVLRRQLQATRDRFQVGEVTRTDVAQAEARVARANSDRAAAEGDLQISRATYERVVGSQPGKLEPPPPLPSLPASLDDTTQTALRENPDVLRANYNEEAAKHAVRGALGVLYPSVSLVGRVQRSDEVVTESLQTRNDSIVAQVVVPLYQSGSEYSTVRQAKEVRSQRMLDIEQARRTATEAARQSWEALTAARERIKGRSEQVRANEIALEGVRQEAAVGSRTTLDVLDAEQELLDSRVALVIAERDEYVAAFRVVAAIGRLSAERLALNVPLYDPSQHYNEVRDKWIGLSRPKD